MWLLLLKFHLIDETQFSCDNIHRGHCSVYMNIYIITAVYIYSYTLQTERATLTPNSTPSYRKLGIRLNADEYVAHRINQANVIFRSMWKLWHRSHRTVRVATRMRLYDTCVKSVLLYNIEGTPLTEKRTRAIQVAHLNHLRQILKFSTSPKNSLRIQR